MKEHAVTEGMRLNEAIDERSRLEHLAESGDLPVTYVMRHENGNDHGEGWVIYERPLDGAGQIERV